MKTRNLIYVILFIAATCEMSQASMRAADPSPPVETIPAPTAPAPQRVGWPVRPSTPRAPDPVTLSGSIARTKTLIIGDSLMTNGQRYHDKDDGKVKNDPADFGPGLAKSITAAGGDACVYSVSSSSYKHWIDPAFGAEFNPVRSDSAHYAKGKLVGDINVVKKHTSHGDWSLAHLLANPAACGATAQPYESLIVGLGANNNRKDPEQPQGYMKQVIKIARERGIKNIRFILPPHRRDSKDDAQTAAYNARAAAYLKSQNIGFFNSLNVQIAAKEFDDEGIHPNARAARRWRDGVISAFDLPRLDGSVESRNSHATSSQKK